MKSNQFGTALCVCLLALSSQATIGGKPNKNDSSDPGPNSEASAGSIPNPREEWYALEILCKNSFTTKEACEAPKFTETTSIGKIGTYMCKWRKADQYCQPRMGIPDSNSPTTSPTTAAPTTAAPTTEWDAWTLERDFCGQFDQEKKECTSQFFPKGLGSGKRCSYDSRKEICTPRKLKMPGPDKTPGPTAAPTTYELSLFEDDAVHCAKFEKKKICARQRYNKQYEPQVRGDVRCRWNGEACVPKLEGPPTPSPTGPIFQRPDDEQEYLNDLAVCSQYGSADVELNARECNQQKKVAANGRRKKQCKVDRDARTCIPRMESPFEEPNAPNKPEG